MPRTFIEAFAKTLGAVALALMAGAAQASFHLYQISQIFSDVSGNIQYIVFADSISPPFGDGQQFLSGVPLTAASGADSNMYSFPNNLPATAQHTTSNSKFLVATQSFANLGVVTPDYIVPDKFLFAPAGSIMYTFADFVSYSALPGDGKHAMDRSGNQVTPTPTNFAGATANCFSVPPISPAGPYDIDGNGLIDPLTDGLLLTRYLLGLRGDSLIASAVGQCATRSTADAIQAYIASQLP